MNCTLVRNLCVIHSLWNTLTVFGLHEYRPIYRFEASAVKATRLILTREFSFQLILLSLLQCDVDHGVEVDILEDESHEQHLLHVCHPGIIILILSFGRRFSFLNLPSFLDALTWDCCCRRCCRCCFSRRLGFTRIVKATVSRCTLEDSSSFQRCSNLVSHTRDIPRQAVKIRRTDYRCFLLFRAMMNRDP